MLDTGVWLINETKKTIYGQLSSAGPNRRHVFITEKVLSYGWLGQIVTVLDRYDGEAYMKVVSVKPLETGTKLWLVD